MGVKIPYRRDMEFEYGRVSEIGPGIRRVICNNPSPWTFHGTGTYLLGRGDVAVIDPGPADANHIRAIVDALGGERISHMLVTHTHSDHSPGCRLLREFTDAKTYAFGPHGAGKLAEGVEVEEGGDRDFRPDVLITDGQIIEGGDWSVECVYTPGHTSNHMCFAMRETKALFTGDHIMAWSTSIISPPDGDMADYIASLEKLLERDDQVYWPTHGPSIVDPKTHVRAFIAHRKEREEQILEQIDAGVHRIEEMVPKMYTELPEFMYPAAGRSSFAAIAYMIHRGVLRCEGEPALDGYFTRA